MADVEERNPADVEAGRRLADARRGLGLTQRALGQRLGISLGLVERLERGEANFARHLDRITDVTGRPACWFLDGSRPTTSWEHSPARPTVEPPESPASARRRRSSSAENVAGSSQTGRA